jgi:ABC-type dipeptide/oligopeptide/nickel transport system permease subunit
MAGRSQPAASAAGALGTLSEGKRKPVEDRGFEFGQLRPSPGFWLRAWRRYRQNRLAMVALVVVTVIVVFAAGADLISRYVTGFTYSENHLQAKLTPPFTHATVIQDGEEKEMLYILGADGNGRDVLTRLAYGGRISLAVAMIATLSLLVIGGLLGSTAGYFGGWIDTAFMRFADVMLSIPTLPLLILVSSFYSPPWWGLALFISLVSWPGVSRIIRGEVLSLRHRDYIEASRVLGASNARILSRHILPNVVPIIVVWASLVVPSLILTEAALSYLGLGVRVPTPSWGNMLQDAKQFVRQAWTLVFIPGFAIYITVLAINLVANGLRDATDPRLNN